MKKITLLLIFLFSLSGYCQFPEGFEASTSLPAGWNQYQNAYGSQKWKIATSSFIACDGSTRAAQIALEGLTVGTTSMAYLVTPLFTVPANGQVRFKAKQGVVGDGGSKLQVMISTDSNPASTASYQVVQEWTEGDLTAIDPSDGSGSVCHELKASLSDYAGQKVYMAFVRVFTQESDPTSTNDRWSVDNVDVVSQCVDPTLGVASNAGATTVTLDWTDTTGSSWDIEYVLPGNVPTGNPTVSGIKSKPFNATNLTPDTAYTYYIRSVCSSANASNWAGPFSFKTYPFGVLCNGAISVPSLPYQTSSNTANFQNLLNGPQDLSALCGANPATIDYLAGNDVFYSYTADQTGLISIKLTPTGPNSSVFVYSSCPTSGPCLAGAANSSSTQRFINNFAVTAGTTYYIVISSAKSTPTVGYTLIIQKEPCTPPVGSSPIGTDLTTTSAKLSWTNPTGATEWEVAVQSLGSPIPTGSGETVTAVPFVKTGLKTGTQYQYYVRSKCASGDFSSWAGPYPFNTLLCEDADKCLYSFKMTDSGANGWGGATMLVRQNGIIVQSIGSTFVGGAGPVTVMVPLCKNLPFDVFWDTPGLQPEQCSVSVVNSFGQTLFAKSYGSGTPPHITYIDGAPGEIMYNNVVNCDKPVCDIPPISLDATTTTHEATLSWSAPATTSWDVYVVPQGTPAPTVLTTPTYAAVTTNPFTVTGLLADTCYDYYVRVVCSSASTGASAWSSAFNFCTLPTCPKPTGLTVTGITKTGATLNWANGSSGDTQWEILLIKAVAPAYGIPAMPPANYVLQPGDKLYTPTSAIPSTPSPFMVTDLETGTVYYYYIRTVCPGNDKSVWSVMTGPTQVAKPFNTVTCDAATKCTYTFVMTDAGKNGWGGGRMQVRQNGIIVGTIGASITTGGPTNATVLICPNVPFDLVWNIAGDHPEEVGIQVLNPFQDPIYTKLPGIGNPPVQGGPIDILFASTGNCTNPTCPKPSALTVTNVTATTASLGWTENATPGATQWEVYVVPTGSAQPINGSPVTGVKPYYKATSNPFIVTNLDPSTTYDFYVRSICSGTDSSTWTLLTPKKFTTVPVNDECGQSIPVPVNSDENCVLKASGNTKGATTSLPATSPVCQGFADDDVWFSFVATSKIHIIDINNIVGGVTDLNHTVYAGNDCATQTQLYCSNPNTSVATNLIVGNTYKIRVYTNDQTVLTDLKSATFDVCITTPPPIVNDDCNTAITLTVNSDLACGQSTPGTLTGATASLPASTCIGTADDDVWYKFVANTLNHYIMLNNVAGSSTDVNHAVYTGDCNNLVLKYCSTGNTLKSTANDFVPGQTYYVRVWSNASTSQKINFSMCIGSVPPPVITSTDKYNSRQLIEDVLLGSKCANVANIHSSTGTNFSTVNGIGYFNKSLSGFPFKEGIVLTSGNALSVPGPNLTNLSEGASSWPGDTDLENIIKEQVPGQTVDSHNASVLEFDFTPLSSTLSFNFLFASEEYGTFQCAFADAFAFILTDPNGNKSNLAVIPDTQLPVSVVTIRNKKYNAACPSQHEELFGQYYGTDLKGLDPLGAPINYNGFTVPLVAHAEGLTAGAVYHIKMVIADNKDSAYDSAVFLEGGSFQVGKIDFGVDLLQTTRNALCFGEKHVIASGLDASKYTFIWQKDNVVIPSETGPSLGIDSPGTYTLQAHYLNGICDTTDSIVIEYYSGATPGTPLPLAVCSSSDKAVFDLTTNSAVILSPFNGDHTVEYYTSSDDANAENGTIEDPTAFQNTVNPQTIYARVNLTDTKCYQIVTFTTTATLNPQFTVSGNMKVCATETTTISVVPTDNNFDPNAVQYVWSFNGNIITNATSGSLTLNGSAAYGSYSVTVTNKGCSATQTFTIGSSDAVWNITFVDEPYVICPGQTIALSFTADNFDINDPNAVYTWTAPDGTKTVGKTLSVSTVGTYSVEVDIFGCKTSKDVTVSANTTPIAIDIQSGCSLNDYKLIAVPVSGSFDPNAVTYEWTASNGGTFTATDQKNTIILKGLGTYNVKVTTPDGCSSNESITVTDITCTIQKGISPGSGTKNASFDLTTLNVKRLEIFNRYGSEVYSLDNYLNEWHGQSNGGSDLPDGTYFYQIHFKDNRITTGWVYINRKQ